MFDVEPRTSNLLEEATVPEVDRDLKEKMVQYLSEGVTVRAFAVAPSVKERPSAIIVVQGTTSGARSKRIRAPRKPS